MANSEYTNRLISESSPYLLQHAHNPVDWYPWGEEALKKAADEGKMMIVSIGYSACHWCHVMEHESFEDPEVADFMNRHFVSIKVDREERPDIDQIYMSAVQLISGSGGWPLNMVTLPDGRPVYGGTYFQKQQWLELLGQLVEFSVSNPKKLEDHVNSLTEGVKYSDAFIPADKQDYTEDDLKQVFENWKPIIDFEKGGSSGAPKFPMPVSYNFLLHFGSIFNNNDALKAVYVTLDNMAAGGIYDQIGGGFARYSTDVDWKVPHFEKMLYDNGQLVSLYAMAYLNSGNERYKQVVYETLDFVKREFTSRDGAFFSALDADSEGVEGKFYVWSKSELEDLLGSDAALMASYYSVSAYGNWEDGINILHSTQTEKQIAEQFGLSVTELKQGVERSKQILLSAREKRIRPGLDDKILTSWNAIMCKGFVDAYRVFNEPGFLKAAELNMAFIMGNMKQSDHRLNRSYKVGKSSINGFLDDYAFVIEALIALYQATFKEQYLNDAKSFTAYVFEHFFDSDNNLFFYTSDLDPKLIARKYELSDNVIPASNSVMAKNLFLLGHYFYENAWLEVSRLMLLNVSSNIDRSGAYFANWCQLMAWFAAEPFEIAIAGENALQFRKELDSCCYSPDVILMGGEKEGMLPLMKQKLQPGKTTIYVCKNKTCLAPVYSIREVLKLIRHS